MKATPAFRAPLCVVAHRGSRPPLWASRCSRAAFAGSRPLRNSHIPLCSNMLAFPLIQPLRSSALHGGSPASAATNFPSTRLPVPQLVPPVWPGLPARHVDARCVPHLFEARACSSPGRALAQQWMCIERQGSSSSDARCADDRAQLRCIGDDARHRGVPQPTAGDQRLQRERPSRRSSTNPTTPAASATVPRSWVREFVVWYNQRHRHEGLNGFPLDGSTAAATSLWLRVLYLTRQVSLRHEPPREPGTKPGRRNIGPLGSAEQRSEAQGKREHVRAQFRPRAVLLFEWPKRSNQEKGHPASAPRVRRAHGVPCGARWLKAAAQLARPCARTCSLSP